ncbi:hypothetical protein CQA70_29190, partial [Klebsiella pneumoniae]
EASAAGSFLSLANIFGDARQLAARRMPEDAAMNYRGVLTWWHMLGEGGGARNNLQHIAGITQAAEASAAGSFLSLANIFGDARQLAARRMPEDAAM